MHVVFELLSCSVTKRDFRFQTLEGTRVDDFCVQTVEREMWERESTWETHSGILMFLSVFVVPLCFFREPRRTHSRTWRKNRNNVMCTRHIRGSGNLWWLFSLSFLSHYSLFLLWYKLGAVLSPVCRQYCVLRFVVLFSHVYVCVSMLVFICSCVLLCLSVFLWTHVSVYACPCLCWTAVVKFWRQIDKVCHAWLSINRMDGFSKQKVAVHSETWVASRAWTSMASDVCVGGGCGFFVFDVLWCIRCLFACWNVCQHANSWRIKILGTDVDERKTW